MEKTQLEILKSYLDLSKSPQFSTVLTEDFNKLKDLTNEIRNFNLKHTNEGEKECNKKKNRYRDILPYDETRIKLDLIKTDDEKCELGSDYINANRISNVLDNYYKYIAAQGPSKETVVDFIRMLVQYNVKVVICACNEYEGQKLKCHRYWTDDLNQPYNFYKNYYVTLKKSHTVSEDCIIRVLNIKYIPSTITATNTTTNNNSQSGSNTSTNTNNTTTINDNNNNNNNKSEIFLEYEFTQYHLTNWPDHGVPNNIESIIDIISLVHDNMIENNRSMNLKSSNKKIFMPLSNDYLVVHCSAGCGRTGTIIAIDQLWTLIEKNKLNENFSIYEIAKSLREQRIAMIQTQSQYVFFAKATAILFDKYLKELNIKSNNEYQNIPVNLNSYNKPDVKRLINVDINNQQLDQYKKSNINITPVVNTNEKSTHKPLFTVSLALPIKSIRKGSKTDPNNNNLIYSDENMINSKQIDIDINNQETSSNNNSNLTMTPKSPSLSRAKQSISKSVKRFTNLPNTMMNKFTHKHNNNNTVITYTPESTPTITNNNSTSIQNTPALNQIAGTNTSFLNTPLSVSSSSSASPSPISLSSSSSSSSSASNSKVSENVIKTNFIKSTTKLSTNNNDIPISLLVEEPITNDEEFDNIQPLGQNVKVIKSQSKIITTPTSTIPNSFNTNFVQIQNEAGDHSYWTKIRNEIQTKTDFDINRARSITRAQSIGSNNMTPIKTSPKQPRKLSNTSENSAKSEYDLTISASSSIRQNSPDNSELYLNDKSLYKKEPGSGCEFLISKLNSQKQYQYELKNNNLPKSIVNIPIDDYVKSPTDINLNSRITVSLPYNDQSASMSKSSANLRTKDIKLIQNAKISSSKQTDLRQMNPPLKAELYESMPKIPSDQIVEQNRNSPNQEFDTPRPPARTKSRKNNMYSIDHNIYDNNIGDNNNLIYTTEQFTKNENSNNNNQFLNSQNINQNQSNLTVENKVNNRSIKSATTFDGPKLSIYNANFNEPNKSNNNEIFTQSINLRNSMIQLSNQNFNNNNNNNRNLIDISEVNNQSVQNKMKAKENSQQEYYSHHHQPQNQQQQQQQQQQQHHQQHHQHQHQQQQQTQIQQTFKLKTQKYDIMTLPNKKYIQSNKYEPENKNDTTHDDNNNSNKTNPFPYYNSSTPTRSKNRYSSVSNIHYTQDFCNLNYQNFPHKSHYYHYINNINNQINSKSFNRKSVKIDNISNEYYDNNVINNIELYENYNDNKANIKRRSTQVFDL